MDMFVVKDSKTGKYITCDQDGELLAEDEPYGLFGNIDYAQGFIDGYKDDESRDWYERDGIHVDRFIVVPVEIKEISK